MLSELGASFKENFDMNVSYNNENKKRKYENVLKEVFNNKDNENNYENRLKKVRRIECINSKNKFCMINHENIEREFRNFSHLYIKDNMVYGGGVEDSLPHGFGLIKYEDYAYFYGNFLHGSREDLWGLYLKPENIRYEGGYKDDQRQGYGIYTYKDGTVYEGFFEKNDLIYGIMFCTNGDNYTGPFKDGKPSGKGVLEKPSGLSYRCEDGIPEKKPFKITYPNGLSYEGEFDDYDYPHGKGALISADESWSHHTTFVHGTPQKDGVLSFSDDDDSDSDIENETFTDYRLTDTIIYHVSNEKLYLDSLIKN